MSPKRKQCQHDSRCTLWSINYSMNVVWIGIANKTIDQFFETDNWKLTNPGPWISNVVFKFHRRCVLSLPCLDYHYHSVHHVLLSCFRFFVVIWTSLAAKGLRMPVNNYQVQINGSWRVGDSSRSCTVGVHFCSDGLFLHRRWPCSSAP